jgi:Mn2+/Fe2+ NRAMP family transporter
MGKFASSVWLKSLAWITAAIIVVLNSKLLFDIFGLTRFISKLF